MRRTRWGTAMIGVCCAAMLLSPVSAVSAAPRHGLADPVPPRGLAAEHAKLWRAILPTPAGDPFFDAWPTRAAAAGEVIEHRDVSVVAVAQMPVPIRQAIQLKFGTRDSAGAPSFGTATMLVPAADWQDGDRPVVVHSLPINSMGIRCTPGFHMAHGTPDAMTGFNLVPPATVQALERGYAVLIPDHEGPRMAYAEPRVAGHLVLDGVRAARAALGPAFDDSRYALVGYSGGGLASYAATMLLPEYAPELRSVVAGAALGGIMTDYRRIARLFDGRIESGILLSVVLAFAREHPEILGAMNELGAFVASSPVKDICGGRQALLGAVGVPLELFSKYDKPLDSDLADRIFRDVDLRGRASPVPLYLFHAVNDPWIPVAGATDLYREQCGFGVAATLRLSPGEHLIGSLITFPGVMDWLDDVLKHGVVPVGCRRH
ncbi:lipase family protein [Nocardia sp. NPDC048505]|uniref:lipase family protein n=1 Tax=Nocardia sp. NPDC048505 TaxID=3155756 RepID=UPI0033E2B374